MAATSARLAQRSLRHRVGLLPRDSFVSTAVCIGGPCRKAAWSFRSS